jgi:hypothetical protein
LGVSGVLTDANDGCAHDQVLKVESSDMASKMPRQMPLSLQRLKRWTVLFQPPKTSGRSRQGAPVRTITTGP